MWAISRGKSCHRNCSLWRNGPRWLISEFLLESRLLRGREGSSLLVHAFTTLLVFSLSDFPFTLHFFLFDFYVTYFLSYLFYFFSFSLFLTYFSLLSLVLALPPTHCVCQGPFTLPAMIGFTILLLNYFCLGVSVFPKPSIGLSAV